MSIPDLKAAGGDDAKLNPKHLSYTHAHNTLIISYAKPAVIRTLEAKNKIDIKKMGNGGTSTTLQPTANNSSATSSLTTAQAIAAEAQSNSKKRDDHSGLEGLKGLKGIANKDGDCKQQ